MIVESIDHIVMTVRDLEKTLSFYQSLGFQAVSFGKNQERKALTCGIQKINLHVYGKEFEPKAAHPTPGSLDLCFLTSIPLTQVIQHLQSLHIPIIEGPVQRTGAQGPILSIYLRDPDDNLIEISNLIH